MTPPEFARMIVEGQPGRPSVRRTGIPVLPVLELMSRGVRDDEILRQLPGLEREDLRACVAYAAELAPGSRAPELELLMARRFTPQGREERVNRGLEALRRLRLPFNLSAETWEEISAADVYED